MIFSRVICLQLSFRIYITTAGTALSCASFMNFCSCPFLKNF
ncbi:hypothetical protein BACCAP_03733 [Pseudoflavonifractor capillosus ATCC 29799]|uniref:Uncharacterized protein n=1 Tax=Pseudoflavonifractor capillosus ATCC 29799 TaxID=411467 RepID=A6NZS8_9FIRM|nr:hypothetical protein BACCAP_03733 [Pseudoflavonifractor capillosus ATCC 29799]